MQIILLYASQYQIADESSGEIKQGVTCNFYFNTDLHAEDNRNGSKGTRPAKGSLDFMLMRKIKSAPALYDAEFEMNIGSDGKPVLRIIDLDYISDVFIASCSDPASVPFQESTSAGPSKAASGTASKEETAPASGRPDKK